MKLSTGYLTKFFIAVLAVLISVCPVYAEQFGVNAPETKKHTAEWGFEHNDGIVLVLCGGGMKGFAHIGVFEAFEEAHIPIAAIVGTSMGSIVGGIYASGMSPEEMKEKVLDSDIMQIMSGRSYATNELSKNRVPNPYEQFIDFTIDKNYNIQAEMALLNTKDLYNFLGKLTSDVRITDFNKLKIPFAAIAVDLVSGKTVQLREGSLASALRASMSFPAVFEPWKMDGMLLVDGGLRANLPVIEAKKMFPGHPVVAINLSDADDAISADKIHSMIDVVNRTISLMLAQQIEDNKAAADIVITPDLKKYGTFAGSGYDEIVELGKQAALENMDAVKKLVSEKCSVYAHSGKIIDDAVPVVHAVRFVGVSDKMAGRMAENYSYLCGQPYDAQAAADMVELFSKRDDILNVQFHTEKQEDGSVDLVFTLQRPQKYEVGVDGYASNITPDRWISATVIARDTFMEGDTASLEGRLSENWGVDLRYFTPLNRHQSQWGTVMSVRRENYEKQHENGSYEWDFLRYTAKAALYKEAGKYVRYGIGYAGSHISNGSTYAQALGYNDNHGPYITFLYNNLDDPVMPKRGFAFESDIWIPLSHKNAIVGSKNIVLSDSRFRAYIPLSKTGSTKVVLKGGFLTGDALSSTYTAMLGTHGDFYSYSKSPAEGDYAYWVHLGLEKEFIRSWWGGINVELFGNYGAAVTNSVALDDGHVVPSYSQEVWEAGVAFSAPIKKFLGKLIFLYSGADGFVVGYSIGTPNFRRGPMP